MISSERSEILPGEGLRSYRVLGVRVHAVQIPEAVAAVVQWSRERGRTRYVVLADMHVVAEARRDRDYFEAVESADLCVADGTPLRLMGRIAGFPMRRRVYGPELMLEVLERTAPLGTRHFFYGGAEGVAEELSRRMGKRFPGLQVAGTHSPPFAPFSPREDPSVIEKINRSAAHILWVGLGAPKQEFWMRTRRDLLNVPVMAGVGAAFDFLSGRVPQAPAWMRENGLEWTYRLAAEPRRLWRRYLVQGADFAIGLAASVFTGAWRKKVCP